MADRWQYKTVVISTAQRAQIDEILNSYGEAGWELVSILLEGWMPQGFMGGAKEPSYRAVFKARA